MDVNFTRRRTRLILRIYICIHLSAVLYIYKYIMRAHTIHDDDDDDVL